jgi:Uma2 family endonuclease
MEDQTTVINEPDFNYSGIYTYADYLQWTIEERIELIKGKIFRMSPAPNLFHQQVSQQVNRRLLNALPEGPCQVFAAPFDVRLTRKEKTDKEITTVVQPDLLVVCDLSKLDSKGCLGAPDLVVEILSPGNNKKELQNKYEVYEENGVKEYWIIHPDEKTFFRYILNKNGKFEPTRLLTVGDVVTTPIIPNLELPLSEVFRHIKHKK